MEKEHSYTGNCFKKAYDCCECGIGNFCDVCHEHEMPRGDCPDCPDCRYCDSEK